MFQVEKEINLSDLKSTYRKLVKQWHPDKFQDGDPLKEEAEIMGEKVVDGYHFLVSIAPETKDANVEDYTQTIQECGIYDFKHKGLLLEITFTNGAVYEYFGMNATVYKKLINADSPVRFAKRSIYNSFLYRKSKKATEGEDLYPLKPSNPLIPNIEEKHPCRNAGVIFIWKLDCYLIQ